MIWARVEYDIGLSEMLTFLMRKGARTQADALTSAGLFPRFSDVFSEFQSVPQKVKL